jgi:hypothetical protein
MISPLCIFSTQDSQDNPGDKREDTGQSRAECVSTWVGRALGRGEERPPRRQTPAMAVADAAVGLLA